MEEKRREGTMEETNVHTVGQFLVDLRRETGLTQKEAADKLGISNKTISRWETDRGLPDVDLLVQVARLYGVTVDELLSGQRGQKHEANISIEKEQKNSMEGEDSAPEPEADTSGSSGTDAKAAWKLFHAKDQFDKTFWILAAVGGVGLVLYMNFYYAVTSYVGTGTWATFLRTLVNVVFGRGWLLVELVVAAIISWNFFRKLQTVEQQDPMQVDACRQERVLAVRKLLVLFIAVIVIVLPIHLGREYFTEEMREEQLGELYQYTASVWKYDERVSDDELEDFIQLVQVHPISAKTYFQYLPLSILTGAALWLVGDALVRILLCRGHETIRKGAGAAKVKSESVDKRDLHDLLRIACVVALTVGAYLLTYQGAYAYADEHYVSETVYESEATFQIFAQGYYDKYQSVKKYNAMFNKPELPDIDYCEPEIDHGYLDLYMADIPANQQYKYVVGFDADTWTVYKTGLAGDYIDSLVHWNTYACLNSIVVAAGMLGYSLLQYKKETQ